MYHLLTQTKFVAITRTLLLLVITCIFFSACDKNNNSAAGTPFEQSSEIRLLDDGKFLLTHSLAIDVTRNDASKGVGFSFPVKYQTQSAAFDLEYAIVYAIQDGKNIPVVEQEKEGFKLIYIGDLQKYLTAGKHTFSFQMEISGYQYSQRDYEEFSWFPIRNFNSSVGKASVVIYPPSHFHPKLGQYFGLVWPKDGQAEPQNITAKVTDKSATFLLNTVPSGSHVQVIARWPKLGSAAPSATETPQKKPEVKVPCSEFGPEFKWNPEIGKCERIGA
jgi:hypothetical protein